MNTFLSDSDISLQGEYQQFARQELPPVANELEAGEISVKDTLKKIAQAGFLGAAVPKQYSGQGGTLVHSSLLTEELGKYEAGVAAIVATHLAIAELINQFGSDGQKSHYLPLLARGEVMATLAYLENDQQVLPDQVKTHVSKQGGKLLLEGTKRYVLNALDSGLFVVLAQEEQENQTLPGLWLIDSLNSQFITLEKESAWFGLSAAGPGKVTFIGAQLEAKNKLAADQNHSLHSQFDFVLSTVRTLLSAICVGMVEGQLTACAEFVRTAQRSGEPLANSQAVQWKLADQATEGAAARLLTYRAAWSQEHDPAQFVKNASMSKLYASKVARTYSGETIQILGIANISADKNCARLYRDAKMIELIVGSSEEQKVLISRELKL